MESPSLLIFIFVAVIAVSNSIPTSPTHQRLGSDEIRITQANRDVCLAKLLCGMSVVTLHEAYDSGTKDGEIYGDYAQIVGKFFQENPSDEFDDGDEDGSLSKESVEAVLEDYSVSTEDDDDDEGEEEPLRIPYPIQRPKRPELKKKVQKQKRRPSAPTTAAAPIVVKKVPPTPKPTPSGIFGLGMPVQESTKARSPKGLSIFRSPEVNFRLSRARKIMRRAGLATKLRTVRQCQRISGCTYTFKQLYQKYGGKGVIDDVSQPIQPLPVVDEQAVRQPQNGLTKVIFAETPSPLDNPWISPADKASPLNNPWVSPSDTSSPSPPAPFDLDVEYGGMNTKIPAGLEPYFQPNQNGASTPGLTNPGTTYKIKKTQSKGPSVFDNLAPSLKKKQRRKKVTTTEAPKTTTTTTTTTEPTTTTTTSTTTTTTTTPPPRQLVHYKRPPPKRRPQDSGDDEDAEEDINKTAPVHLIGNHEHDFDDEAADRHKHKVEYEDEDEDRDASQDDYDEEAKYNVPVDYGNDEESEESDEEDRPNLTKQRPRPRPKPDQSPKLKTKQKPGPRPPPQSDEIQGPVGQGYSPAHQPHLYPSSQLPKYRPKPSSNKFTNEFQSVQTGRLKKLKKKGQGQKELKEDSSEEPDVDDDADFQDDAGPPAFEYPTHIGGRPIFPDYDVPVTAYGMTRSTMAGKTKTRPQPQPGGPGPVGPAPRRQNSPKQSSTKDSPENDYPYHYNYPPPGSSFDQNSGQLSPQGGMDYQPTSGMSVLTPIKSLFKHLSSGSMGYTQHQSPSSLHYNRPPAAGTFGGGSGPQNGPTFSQGGISVPLQQDESANVNIPQIAIMPQIPKGPESSEYKRPGKYTINKTKKIPSL